MRPISTLQTDKIEILLTDIDGTLTAHDGRIPDRSYQALWKLYHSEIKVIPVTGRPAGWCEMIARTWPVHGVIGENGALYYRLQGQQMRRFYSRPKDLRKNDRLKLKEVLSEIREKVPQAKVASDQFCRMFDLAIDFAEDVARLPQGQIDLIVEIFKSHGAVAKVSNIHVNGWFGKHDKLSTCKAYLARELGIPEKLMKQCCAFIGDSPNDEPMFEYFPNSIAVANIKEFLPRLKHKPGYICKSAEADGFVELANRF